MITARIYKGWLVMAGAFLSAALAIGFTSYIFGMFAVPVTEEFGLSRANYNNGYIALMAGIALASPLAGKLLDKFSARLMIALSGIGFGGALVAISTLDSILIILFLLLVPLALGVAACGVLGANTITVRWFDRRRGRVLGILALSTSVGGFLSQPFTGWLISTLGWRDALFTIGVMCICLFSLLALLLIRDRPKPSTSGYAEEFSESARTETRIEPKDRQAIPPVATTWTAGQLLKNVNFWLFASAIGIFFGVDQAIIISLVPYFLDSGFTLETAAILVSIKTISAIGGKLIVGYLSDKIDLRILFACVASCNVMILTIYIIQPQLWVLVCALALLGIAVGGVFPVWTTSIAWLFGTASYGTAMGMTAVFTQAFAMISIRFIGEVHDMAGSYKPAFMVFICLVLIAILLVSRIKPPTKQ